MRIPKPVGHGGALNGDTYVDFAGDRALPRNPWVPGSAVAGGGRGATSYNLRFLKTPGPAITQRLPEPV
jgi:hypothetical protein